MSSMFPRVAAKSRSYLINDWLCNCRFNAHCVPPTAMGFLDNFGASGLMWKCRACRGTHCFIHQVPPAQRRGSIPAPTPRRPPPHPAHCDSLQRCWRFLHAGIAGRAASVAWSEAGQAAPVLSDPHRPPPAPLPLHAHTFAPGRD